MNRSFGRRGRDSKVRTSQTLQVDIRGKQAIGRTAQLTRNSNSRERSGSNEEITVVAKRNKRHGASVNNKKRYTQLHKDVNLKQEKRAMKYDPFLPFQNVKIGKVHYIVPTLNPKSAIFDPKDMTPIGLTIEKISNPSREAR